jgi:hypothetical protein
MLRTGLPAAFAALILASAVHAQDTPPPSPLSFSPAGHATVSGAVRGDTRVAYAIEVKAGEDVTLTLASKDPAVTADLLTPEGESLAIDIGTEHPWENPVPTTGLHSVVVYLREPHSSASAPFTLTVDRKAAGSEP